MSAEGVQPGGDTDAARAQLSTPPPSLRAGFAPADWRRLQALDAHVAALGQGAAKFCAPEVGHGVARPGVPAYDVALVGGGLHVLLAPLLARQGLRVVVLERARAAAAHREWNASRGELQALVEAGLCDQVELGRLVVAQYRGGTCRWHGGGDYPVAGVLDCAVDAQGLLSAARVQAESAGVKFVDGVTVSSERGHARGVTLRLRPTAAGDGAADAVRTLEVAAMVDARGAASPYNRADLICPTVGGVLRGLTPGTSRRQLDVELGEILATTEDVEEGRQHIWEAFPGRTGEVAVYLFYYSPKGALPTQPLARLYRRFEATLPRFKAGHAQLVRPTFGLIPGWSRLTPPSRAPHPRIVLVGDAAGRHSPLTFCGFGAMLRSLQPAVTAVREACRGGASQLAVDDRPLHRLTGALATLLARPPRGAPARLNALLDHAFATLHAMGPATYAGLLQDTLPPAEALRFVWRTSRRDPQVWRQVLGALGPLNSLRWALQSGTAALRGPRSRTLPGRGAVGVER